MEEPKKPRTPAKCDPFATPSFPAHIGPSPSLARVQGLLYAARFSVDVVGERSVFVRSSTPVSMRGLRLRGSGCLMHASIDQIDGSRFNMLAAPCDIDVFADRWGGPRYPRTVMVSSDDAVDDSSDGCDVDWGVFGRAHQLELRVSAKRLHVLMTVLAFEPWPSISFALDDGSPREQLAWNTVTVADYFTRKGPHTEG